MDSASGKCVLVIHPPLRAGGSSNSVCGGPRAISGMSERRVGYEVFSSGESCAGWVDRLNRERGLGGRCGLGGTRSSHWLGGRDEGGSSDSR